MILKAKREKGLFLCYSKIPVRDCKLSLEAKGLLSIAMDKPPKHTLTIQDVMESCKNGKDSVRSAFRELIANGYMRESQGRTRYGKVAEMQRDVSDTPLFRASEPQAGNPVPVYGQSNLNHQKKAKKPTNRESEPQTGTGFLAALNNKSLKDLLLRILNKGEGDNFCHQVFEYLKTHMDRPTFETWIHPLSIKTIDDRLYIIAPDDLSCKWIQSNFIGIILDAFSYVSGCKVSGDDLIFTVYEGSEKHENDVKKSA